MVRQRVSAVAYCIGITNIDPIKYNLLFERFLNPDRKSMPDIDTDFDDEGRQKVIDYVVEKYGKNQVAQIVTYGTMAAKIEHQGCGAGDGPAAGRIQRAGEAGARQARLQMTLNRIFDDPLDGEDGEIIARRKRRLSDADDLENVKTAA